MTEDYNGAQQEGFGRSQQTKSLDQDKIADYIRSHTFKTVVG